MYGKMRLAWFKLLTFLINDVTMRTERKVSLLRPVVVERCL